MASSVFVTLPGVSASDTGESPMRQLQERAEKIPGDKKHDPELTEFSHRVIASRSSIQHKIVLASGQRLVGRIISQVKW